jgi:hypothetical protein
MHDNICCVNNNMEGNYREINGRDLCVEMLISTYHVRFFKLNRTFLGAIIY